MVQKCIKSTGTDIFSLLYTWIIGNAVKHSFFLLNKQNLMSIIKYININLSLLSLFRQCVINLNIINIFFENKIVNINLTV